MKPNIRKRLRRLGAGVGVAALALTGSVTAVYAADAAIEPDTPVSLTIHKYQYGAFGTGTDAGSISNPTGLPGNGIPGVVFTAYPISSLDLATPGAWTDLGTVAGMAAACAAPIGGSLTIGGDPVSLGTGIPATTDAAGIAELTEAEMGQSAYLVCETTPPANTAQKAQPFVVTLPTPGPDGEWVYDVHVYPKNLLDGTYTKTFDTSAALATSDAMNYTVSATMPTLNANDFFQYLYVQDTFPAGWVPSASFATTAVPQLQLSGQPTATPLDSTEYAITQSGAAPNPVTVTVALTRAGMNRVKAAPGGTLSVTFAGTRSGDLPTGSVYENTANVFLNVGASEPPADPPPTPPTDDPGNPTNTTKTSYGNAIVVKHDAASETLTLPGAEFDLYPAAPDDATPTGNPLSCTGAVRDPGAAPIVWPAGIELVSGANGIVTIPQLVIDATTDGSDPATSRCYVLVETLAPTGYVTPAATTDIPVLVTAGASTATDLLVPNTKNTVPELPLTGAQGQILFVSVGAVLLAAAVAAVVISRKRKQPRVSGEL